MLMPKRNRPAMQLHDVFRNGQPQSGAGLNRMRRAEIIGLVEAFKQMLLLLRRNRLALVLDRNPLKWPFPDWNET
ncbi:hypothetical protein J6TS7_27760 [Paenibacillus dendritiformis]|nr:hypothetical protein J6TS7_27760 [Paenibacillus dendritiformis]